MESLLFCPHRCAPGHGGKALPQAPFSMDMFAADILPAGATRHPPETIMTQRLAYEIKQFLQP
ncbi:hypothetical protein I2I11_06945 [Pontibacter sp. 172403-2]|uniref:hypothetical protein n=1 Tax=Pontibacter rufus TaxID=2791028 RepID=UPI0018AFF0A6|nr:hypothetical protein [Pontibacter sp. 172403-2]MBF9253022.1 hypothetical protein [Pontibacter sp. 172403-2]